MIIPKYRSNVLFFKLPKSYQEDIIREFPQYYRDNSITPNTKSDDELMSEIRDHFLLYDETRLFNKYMHQHTRLYTEKVLNEDIISEEYPELFI